MADIAATDVTYTMQVGTAKANPADPRFSGVFKIAFGDSSLTYPSGGIPLTKGKLGCPANIDELTILDDDDGNGYAYKFNREGNTIKIYQSPARTHAHDLLIIGGQASTTDNEVGHYATDILGKEAATNATIAKADSATKGGVISETLAAAALTEVTAASHAPAATVLYVKVVGY